MKVCVYVDTSKQVGDKWGNYVRGLPFMDVQVCPGSSNFNLSHRRRYVMLAPCLS